MNYSYITQPPYCKGTPRNFDPIKNYFLFSPLYAKTNRPILVPIAYHQCVEGGATKCMYGHSSNLLYRDWMTDKLDNREPSVEETQMHNHLLALQLHCNVDLFPVSLQLAWHVIRSMWNSSGILTIGPLISSSNIERRPQTYNTGLNDPKNLETHCSQTHSQLSFFSFYVSFVFTVFNFLHSILLCHN